MVPRDLDQHTQERKTGRDGDEIYAVEGVDEAEEEEDEADEGAEDEAGALGEDRGLAREAVGVCCGEDCCA